MDRLAAQQQSDVGVRWARIRAIARNLLPCFGRKEHLSCPLSRFGAPMDTAVWGQLVPLGWAGLSVWRWRTTLSFEALRPYGVTQTGSHLLRNLAVPLMLYCFGVTIIEIFWHRVDVRLLLFAPALAAAFVVVVMAGALLPRDAFWRHDDHGARTGIRWGRFLKVQSSPLAAALAPISNVALNRLPDVFQLLGIGA